MGTVQNILIITQKIDMNDAVLGFMHGWILEFAKRFEKVTVICLEKGIYDFPQNVCVLSLGKEEKRSRLRYLVRLYRFMFAKRHAYDTVFVHMNQEYVLFGYAVWRLLGKKILLWRNHLKGSVLTDMAILLSDKVFCTSNQSYTARFKKAQIMPVGIDTSLFTDKREERVKNSLLILGRIAPVKKQGIIIDALGILSQEKVFFNAHFIGNALPYDMDYYDMLQKKASEAGMSEFVSFEKAIPNRETPKIYNAFEVFINATQSGSMDKTIFEAMACGALPIISNKDLSGIVDQRFIFKENDASDLAGKVKELFLLSNKQKSMYRAENLNVVTQNHSLESLIDKITLLCKGDDV